MARESAPMNLSKFVATALGEFSWRPPAWLQRAGSRRVGYGAAALVGAVALAGAGYLYYENLPKPLQVQVAIAPPGLSSIDRDELVIAPLQLDFAYPDDPAEAPPPLSAARLDLVGDVIEEGVELEPPIPGEWSFVTENRLVFTPAEDWPADREHRVRLSSNLFAPHIELADRTVVFETPPFVAEVLEASFYQHPEIVAERRVTASFGFSHAVLRDDFEQRLTLAMRAAPEEAPAAEARELGFRVEYGPHDRTAHVHSDIVAIPEKENFAAVTVDGDLEPADGDGVFEEPLFAQVRVPDRESYFRVERIEASIVRDTEGDPLQTAALSFTDQVNTEEFASGVRAWLLPRDRRMGGSTHRNYRWRSPGEATAEVLAESEPLALTANPTERDAAMLQSLAFDAPPGRFVYLRVAPGLTSAGGFVLASGHDAVVRAPDYPREAAIAQDGALLPLTGNRLLTFSGRGVSAVRVDIQQLLPDTLNHLASQTGGDIRNPWFQSGWAFDADNLSALTTRIVELNPAHPREQVYATLDLDPFLDAGGVFFVQVQGWDPERERSIGRADRRMALVTDLGLLVKTNADASQHVFVHSIATGSPVTGAEVQILGKNGLPVLKATTDAEGHAALASARDFERDRAPTVFVVRKGADVTFMPYRRDDRRLRWSGFDIGGERTTEDDAERLRAALYTDRGLYRPGETVRLFGIVREGDFESVPGAPIEMRIADARGNSALETRVALPDDGLLTWDFETRPESPTGVYRASVYLVQEDGRRRALGDSSFRVEEYQPDRLRIRAAIVEQVADTPDQAPSLREVPRRAWLHPAAHQARVTLHNLFGTPAQGRRVRATVRLTPVSPNFAEHPGFVFTDPFRDPGRTPKAVSLEIAEATTGTDGIAMLPFDIGQYDNGIYSLLLNAQGFEASGGRGVKALAGTFVSSAQALVGYRTDGALDFVTLDSARTVRFLAIDRDLEPLTLEGLQSVLVERRYVSALIKQPNGRFAYQSVAKETELERTAFALPAGGAEVALPASRPGRFAIDIVDARNTRLARVEFAVAGTANIAGNLERDAELDLKLDRREYAPGDEILLEVTAPYAGTGLVTIERDRVHAFRWFRTETNNALARIRVPEGLAGNAYVNVAFVRDIDSEEIFVSPLSYAVAPFAVDRASRRLDIDLAVPGLVRPGDALTVGYTASEPARLVLFAVDEGILQVADYDTPDPLEDYLRKKALQVDTHQMVDLILPDYDVLRRAAAPGGGDRARLLGANLNPFRRRSEPPVVYWSGILEADSGQREVAIDIPDYFDGELRVMAVGVGAARLGAQAEPVTVRGQVVLTPNLPLAAAPNDLFDVAVGIANHVEGSGEEAAVTVSAEALQRLSVDGASERAVAVAEGDEGRALFRLRAGGSPGAASVTFAGRVNDVSVQRRATLSVRPSTAFQTRVHAGFDADGETSLALPRRLHEAFADRRVTASASPLALADGLLAYLETFPHACAEQIVSKAFPQLGLLEAESSGLDRQDYRALFRNTIDLLRPRQNADGGFLFWSTSRESAAFPSVYVTHFLTDARELGMPVPDDLYGRSGAYLQRVAGGTDSSAGASNGRAGSPDQSVPFDLGAARTRAYAIYLMTRRGRVTTNYLNALQESLETGAPEEWRSDIASAYMAASHSLLQNHVLAGGLIEGYRLGESSPPDTDFDTGLGRDALYVYLLARHFPDRMAQLDGDAVRRLVQPVFEDRFNTLSAAYTILALGAIHRNLEASGELAPPAIAARAADGPVKVDVAPGAFARASLPVSVERLDISAAGPGGVFYTASESGFDVEAPTERIAEGIELDRVYLDAEGERLERIRVGDELTVRLRVRSTSGRVGNVAVADLLPGGFEIVTESVRRHYGGWSCDYLDVREDRLVYYGSFDERMVELRYRVKATSPGEFAAPAAYATAMYHRSVRGRSAGGRLVVESM